MADRRARVGEIVRSLAFYAGFYGASVLASLATPLVIALAPARLPALVTAWSSTHRRLARRLLGIEVAISGTPPMGAVLVALKHQSFFEAIDLPLLLDRPAIFAKAELLRLPLWGRAARTHGVVPVERDAGAPALRAMLAAARGFAAQGRVLAIFPEGTRVPAGEEAPLQSGFAGLYKQLGLPVVPVAVSSGALYHRWWKRAGRLRIAFGETIPPGLERAEIEARVLREINRLEPDAIVR